MMPIIRQAADSKNLPQQQCPICRYKMDCATVLENDESVRPEVGDVSLCLKCGEILVYGDGMILREAQIPDILKLDDHAKQLLDKAQRLIRSKRFLG